MNNNAMTFEAYSAMVAKMVENHGVLDARQVVPAMPWLRDAFAWGMSPVRAATKATNQLLTGAR